MSMFWLGVAAFATLSFVVNMFDADFREAVARAGLGLVIGPFFLLMLAAERVLPRAGTVSATTLQRFADSNPSVRGWAFSYRWRGVLIVKDKKRGNK